MEQISLPLGKYKIEKVVDEKKVLSDEIYEWLGRRIHYGVIRKIVNEKGTVFCRETMIELQRSNPKDNAGLFLSICGKTKIKWKSVDK